MGTYFTNGKATISVTVHDWDDTTRQYTPDRSADFYDVGSLKSFVAFMFGRYELVYVCDSIDSLIDQASDAVYGIGRYDTPSPNLVVDITTPVVSPSRLREQVMTMAPRTIDADDTIRDDRAMLVTTLIRALAAADAGNVHTVAASLARAHDITERLIAADEAGM